MLIVSRILIALVVAALALPAASTAHLRTIAPPGNPAISQYLETVPTDKGQSPTSSSQGSQPSANQPSALTPAQRQTLEHAGSDGRTLVGVVNATSPTAAPTRGSHGRRNRTGAASAGGGGSGPIPEAGLSGRGVSSPTGSLVAAVGGSGGMGALLPILLGIVVLGVIARAAIRWRRTRAS